MSPSPANVIHAEINQFNALAAEWWDINGPMAPLHRMNPIRLEYLVQTLTRHFGTIKGLRILDVGCGGGIVAEPLARLGAIVTGIDGAEDLIHIAQNHAKAQKLEIDYRPVLTQALVAENTLFDVVLGLEIIEHVPDPDQFVADLAALTRPGGLVITSTLNRNLASLAFGVIAAEYILRWLPVGTHQWRRFLKPSELFHLCEAHGLKPVETMGLTYRPRDNSFVLDADNLKINYFMTAKKP